MKQDRDQETAAKTIAKTWHEVQQSEEGQKLAYAKMWENITVEKTKKQCQKYLIVYVDG